MFLSTSYSPLKSSVFSSSGCPSFLCGHRFANYIVDPYPWDNWSLKCDITSSQKLREKRTGKWYLCFYWCSREDTNTQLSLPPDTCQALKPPHKPSNQFQRGCPQKDLSRCCGYCLKSYCLSKHYFPLPGICLGRFLAVTHLLSANTFIWFFSLKCLRILYIVINDKNRFPNPFPFL